MKIQTSIKEYLRKNLSLILVTLLIFLFIVVYFWQSIFITIGAGEGGVLYRRFFGGTVVDKIYAEGFHVIAPWDTMTKYNVRYQVIHHSMYALTRKGMKIGLTLTVRYMPEYRLLGVLHKKVGPTYPDKIVIPEAEAVIRKIIGRFDAGEVYSTKRALIQKIVDEAITQISQRYIRIDDMIITKVELPTTIKAAIEAKLEQRELAEAYEFILIKEEKEAQRKRIEALGFHDYNETINASLTNKILTWRGVQATLELARSNNAKVVVIGSGQDGLPIILDAKDWNSTAPSQDTEAKQAPQAGSKVKSTNKPGSATAEGKNAR